MSKSDEELKRIHIELYSDDLNWLKSMFGGFGKPGVSHAIRMMINRYRRSVEEHNRKDNENV